MNMLRTERNAAIALLLFVVVSCFFLNGCRKDAHDAAADKTSLQTLLGSTAYIEGDTTYLASPYVTAGDRVYMIGHQDGTFPDLGWHVAGEMGGIWNHPIKLMDGFAAVLSVDSVRICLAKADRFVNFPFANKHIYQPDYPGLLVERFQFVPDGMEGMVVEYTIRNEREHDINVAFEWVATTDLRPVWLGEQSGLRDGPDELSWNEAERVWMARDAANNGFVAWGSSAEPSAHAQLMSHEEACLPLSNGLGARGSLSYAFRVNARQSLSIPFFIAGSSRDAPAALQTITRLKDSSGQLLQEKIARYDSITRWTQVSLPDKKIQQAFTWIKYNTDWLMREVPEQGRGLSAGLPDYPWWFGCDNTYALRGLLATGRFEDVVNTIDLLARLSEQHNGNGRIVHEVSTNGVVFNPGNVNETPQFASLIWATYQWTGDSLFLRQYFPLVEKGLAWLLAENDKNANLLPDGFGMMEIHGMDSEMIDVAVYTQQAFADASRMARVLKKDSAAVRYRDIAGQIRRKINNDFWVPESQSYADFIGTRREAEALIRDAIVRADTLAKPWAVDELKNSLSRLAAEPPGKPRGFVVHHNWVVNTPMEMGIADTAKALQALETASRFVNPFGMFVTGIDRDESAGTDVSSFAKDKKIFSYVGAVMTLPTGVQAIAENNYGRPDRALDYLQRLARSFSYALPGSMYEVSPDFGMMAQAWNLYAIAYPVVHQFFGIQPAAAEKSILIKPAMPTSWHQASIENLRVGDQEISVYYHHSPELLKLTIRQSNPEWKVVLRYPENTYRRWTVNGVRETPEPRRGVQELVLTGDEFIIELLPQ